MPSPDVIDERFDEIVRELRTLPGAPERLRERVRELAAQEPAPQPKAPAPWKHWLTFRSVGWTIATVGAGFVVVALGYGIATSSGPAGDDEQSAGAAATTFAQAQERTPQPNTRLKQIAPPAAPPPTIAAGGAGESGATAAPSAADSSQALTNASREAVTLPPGRRLAQYTASMRLRVSDIDELSVATRDAMGVARDLGGFVASVNYATPKGDDGDAYLTLRVPTAKIQEAIARLSDLGVIVSQNIKIADVQNRVNDDNDAIGRLRRTIRRLEARLDRPISEDERFRIELQLEQARASLKRLTERRDATVRRARLAKISVALTTREGEKQVAPPPGRIDRAVRNAGSVLAKEVAAVVYVLIVVSPLLLLGAAALVASRAYRRRFDQRLLEQA